MKKICTLWCAIVFFGLPALAQTNGHAIRVAGIVSLPGFQCVLLEVEPALRLPRELPLILAEGQKVGDIEVQQIHPETGTVDLTDAGKKSSLEVQGKSEAQKAETSRLGIHLRDTELPQVVKLYGILKGRTVLQHPVLPRTHPMSLDAVVETRAQANTALESMFEREGMTAVPDGRKFVMLVPTDLTNSAAIDSVRPPEEMASPDDEEILSPGMINFRGAPMAPVFLIYSEMTGKRISDAMPRLSGQVSLLSTTPLTRSEVIYALETIFTWNGIGIVTNADNTIEAVPMSQTVAPRRN